jgi:hypothetical protein
MMKIRDLFHYETPDLAGGAPPAPGTGETPDVDPATSAATETTEAQGTPPGPIPYARFKEVNDARRELEDRIQPYEVLTDVGYGADELQRLVAWEQEYTQDPVGTWLRQAGEIDDLPSEVKAAIEQYSAGSTQGNSPADGGPPPAGPDISVADDELAEPPEWAQPLLQEREARIAQEQEQAVSHFYDAIVEAWKELDVQQGLVDDQGNSLTPAPAMHAFIASASVSAGSAQELLRNAREGYLSSREVILQTGLKVPGQDGQTVPRSVPGGGGGSATGATPPPRPRTLREATRMAQADLAAQGQLGPSQ